MAITNNSYEELRKFIVERLLKLDPTLDSSSGARIYSTVVTPLLTRLGTDPMSVDMESFITQRMQDEYPELDVTTPGSTLRDVLVSPLVLLLTPLRREIEHLRQQSSLADYESLNSDEMDALLANVLSSRRVGSYAYGSVRIYFSAPKTVGIDSSIIFTTTEGLQFIADESRTFLPSQMTRAGNLWYIDVSIRSAEPTTDANVGPNQISTALGLDNVVKVVNLKAIAGGITTATNEEFLQQAERALTERSLNTKRGIETTIIDNIAGVTSVEVVGFGEANMQRDILKASVLADTGVQVGAAVYTTANFKTMPVALLSGNIAPPVTNILRLYNMDATSWAAIVSAKYLRVFDGNSSLSGIGGVLPWFKNQLLSRLREIAEVGGLDTAPGPNQNTVIVRLKDFDIYPAPATLGAATTVAASADTNVAVTSGFNQYAKQGINYRLYGTDSSGPLDYPIGAPLPFTDVVTTLSLIGAPNSVVFGQDYLLALTETACTDNTVYDGTAQYYKEANSVRLYPAAEVVAATATEVTAVRIARVDAHLLDAAKISAATVASAGYPEDTAYTAGTLSLAVVAFGAPKASFDPNIAYEGLSTDTWGKYPGASFTGDSTDVTTQAKSCLIRLSAAQPITWGAVGVEVGQYISLAFCAQVKVAPPAWDGRLSDFASQLYWQGWGLITEVAPGGVAHNITVVGVDWTGLAGLPGVTQVGAQYATDLYPLYWTVFVGKRNVVLPDGSLTVPSYDEVQFLPAYKISFAMPTSVACRGVSPFNTNTTVPSATRYPNTIAAKLTGMPGSGGENAQYLLWLRLDKPFQALDSTVGAAPVTLSTTELLGELNNTTGVPNLVAPLLVPATIHTQYGDARMPDMSGHTLVQYAALPMVEATMHPFETVAIQQNAKRHTGYLLPYPMGDADTLNVLPLTGQLVQFYAAAEAETPIYKLTLSDIPGGVPFPGALGTPVEVNNDTVHIGGATDVYIKTAAPVEDTVGALFLGDTDTSVTGYILVEGTDGEINDVLAPTIFKSALLRAWLFDHVSTVPYALDNLVVEIVDSPVAPLSPLSARVLAIVAATNTDVRVDATFAGVGGAYPGLRWRLVNKASVSLTAPAVLLQQGTDARTYANTPTVAIPSGILFTPDPATAPMYLKFLTGEDQELEFRLVSKTATSVELTEPVPHAATGVSYQVYTKQPSGLSLPVVQVTRVFLDDGSNGVDIPYKHPVHQVLSSVAGWGATLITEVQAQGGGTLSATSQFTATAVYDFAITGGIKVGDVLHLKDTDQYFYITVVAGAVLTVAPSNTVAVTVNEFEVGTPAVGEITLLFRNPTYLRVFGDTVFTHTDSTGTEFKFRPDPFFEGIRYTPLGNTTDYLVDAANAAIVTTTADDLFALGVRAGDLLEVGTYRISSTGFAGDVPSSGHTLLAIIDGVSYSIKFPSTALAPAAAANTINQQVQAAGVYVTTSGVLPNIYMHYYCRTALELRDGTTGACAALQVTSGVKNNTLVTAGDYAISSVEDIGPGTSGKITLATAITGTPLGKYIFIRVKTPGAQYIYPADMTAETNGLYSCKVSVISYDPFLEDTLAKDAEVTINTAYDSLGYDFSVANANYSYSVGESLVLNVTPTVLDAAATSFADVYTTPASDVSVSYEHAPEVSDAQTFLMRQSVRITCNSPLARHYLPAYPLFSLQYTGVTDPDTVAKEVQAFLVSLYPNKQLEVYDLLTVLARLNVDDVQGPVEVSLLCQDASRVWSLKTSENAVAVDKNYHVMGELDYVTITRG